MHRQNGARNVCLGGTRNGVLRVKVERGVLTNNRNLVEAPLQGEHKSWAVGASETPGIDHAILNVDEVDVLLIELLGLETQRDVSALRIAIESEQSLIRIIAFDHISVTRLRVVRGDGSARQSALLFRKNILCRRVNSQHQGQPEKSRHHVKVFL